MCYLFHLSTAVLFFIELYIALCNCSNAIFRYDVTCRYSNNLQRRESYLQATVFSSLIIRHPRSKVATQHIKMFHNHRTILSDTFFLHLQCLTNKNFKLCKLLEYLQVTSYRTLAFEQLHSAMQKSMQHCTAVERCNK